MSVGLQLILSTSLVAAAPGCSWAHPGANPYRGEPVRALADFGLPAATRRELRARMVGHRPTDVVTISRDDIVGAHAYDGLREMHSGGGRVCHGNVDRSAWSARRREPALVYCAGDACVIVPRICHNVALVSRRPDGAGAPDDGPIDIEPSAGPPPADTAAVPPVHAAPPIDRLPPPDVVGLLPAPPDVPGDGGGGDGFVGPPVDGTPIGGGPIGGELPCCELGPVPPIVPIMPITPGGPGLPPSLPVPEAPAAWSMLAGLALVWRLVRRRP